MPVMSEFATEISDLRASAAAAADAGESATRVRLHEGLDQVATALPGSRSAGAVPALVSTWERRLDHWATDLTTFGTDVGTNADLYQRSDEAARDAFAGGLLGRLVPWP